MIYRNVLQRKTMFFVLLTEVRDFVFTNTT